MKIQRMGGLTGPSRADARAVEQALIEREGLSSLANAINSIAKVNLIHDFAVRRGQQILHSQGHAF